MNNPITDIIEEKGWCVADGATGSNLFGRGLEAGYPPELWCLERPEEVAWLHREFLQAGADLILTNSFGGNSSRLELHASEQRVGEINFAAAQIAMAATKQHLEETGRKTVVGGSIGPTGALFAPMGMLDHEQAFLIFTEQAKALAEGGVEVLWIETMSCIEEVAAASEAAQKTGLPVCATLTFDTAKRSMMGVTPSQFAKFARDIGLNMVGANCGVGPAELMDSALELIATDIELPIVVKGNCGIPQYIDGAIHYRGSPELMAQYALFARDAGASIIGGCCGTTPAHVLAMVKKLDSTARRPFDANSMIMKLGAPWANLKSVESKKRNQSGGSARRRSNRRRPS